MSKNVKKRNWAFVLYPESAPEDWRERLQLSGLMGAISPLHDKDINPTGEPKKEHYHVILIYGSPTTYNNVKSFVVDDLGQPIPQALEQVKGYYRYLTHMDNPDKYQYDEAEIQTFNGFDISDFVEMSKSEVNRKKLELLGICRKMQFVEYCQLVDYVVDNMDGSYFDIVSNHTMFFNGYLTSIRCCGGRPADMRVVRSGRNVYVVNERTGEVISERVESAEIPLSTKLKEEERGKRASIEKPTTETPTENTEMPTTETPTTETPTTETPTENTEMPTENTEKPTENTEMPTENTEMPTEMPTDFEVICCRNCGSVDLQKNGKTKAGSQLWRCKGCGKKFVKTLCRGGE